ncbi:DUF6082 family protein [Nonomuraea sp. CA-143628]|uniref:DUF6082 family protein n=1 Tax=Nonomuraea sp. CA-143628 TaxID=3239997 RepID=UPI003D91F82E
MLVLSPVALGGLARLIPVSQWSLLSDVGQAYGPVATILTCLSLAGLAFSVFVQARTTHVANEQTTRMLHMELIRWAMDDPSLLQADGELWSGPQDDFELRLYIYYNQWMVMWRSLYNLRQITEEELRFNVRSAFKGEIAREHWRAHRDEYVWGSQARRHHAFTKIVDDEWLKAQRSPSKRPVPRPVERSNPGRALTIFGMGVALSLGAVLVRRRWQMNRAGR